MGRDKDKSSEVHKYFLYFKDEEKSQCKICDTKLTGCGASNLKKHLQTHSKTHPEVLKEVEEKDKARTSLKRPAG